MKQCVIRPAQVGDIPKITTIYRHWVVNGTATFETDPPDEIEMKHRLDTVMAGNFPYLVADNRDGDGVIGYAYASAFRTRAAYRSTVEDSIYVAPGVHRTGVGRRLLQALVDDCTRRGYRQMIAVIGDSGQQASISLHGSVGFVDAGRLLSVGYKFNRWLDGVLMQRPLGDGDTTPPTIAMPSAKP